MVGANNSYARYLTSCQGGVGGGLYKAVIFDTLTVVSKKHIIPYFLAATSVSLKMLVDKWQRKSIKDIDCKALA